MIYTDFFSYVLKPKLGKEETTFRKKIKNIFKLFILDFVLSILFLVILRLIIGFDAENLIDKKMEKLGAIKFFIYGVITAPMIEELIFRLLMVYKKINIVIGVLFASIFLSSIYFNQPVLILSENSINIFVFSILTSLVSYYIVKFYNQKFIVFYKKYFGFIFYFSSIIFALGHLSNFEPTQKAYLLPLVVVPQFFGGVIMGFLRVKYGFFYGLFFHCLNNFIVLIVF